MKIAIIPARGGSKRIPGKNIKQFCGKPIIQYSIDAALESRYFDEVMVSTDDHHIRDLSIRMGARVPFLRSPENSNDFATTADVIVEVLEHYNNNEVNFEYGCCLYPTAPFVSPKILKKSYDLMRENDFQTVFPVCTFSYPILRALSIDAQGRAAMIWPENLLKRSQDLPLAYHDAGQFYWFNIVEFLRNKNLYSNRTGAVIVSELETQDIDNETDWVLAELKYQLSREK